MSGLFRRLAGQALGEPSGVKPRSSARFAELVATPQRDEAAPSATLDPSRVAATPRSADGESPRTRREPSWSEHVPRPDEPRAIGSRHASTPLGETPLDRRPASLPPEPPLLMPLERAEPDHAAHRIAPARSPAAPNRSVPGPAVRSERRTLSAEREPEPNEVHVHIGRIEVTAVHEPARKRESAARPAPSRRLEDYLRPRGGG